MTSNSLVPYPKLKKPRTHRRIRIASAEMFLTVPTYCVRISDRLTPRREQAKVGVGGTYVDSLRVVTWNSHSQSCYSLSMIMSA